MSVLTTCNSTASSIFPICIQRMPSAPRLLDIKVSLFEFAFLCMFCSHRNIDTTIGNIISSFVLQPSTQIYISGVRTFVFHSIKGSRARSFRPNPDIQVDITVFVRVHRSGVCPIHIPKRSLSQFRGVCTFLLLGTDPTIHVRSHFHATVPFQAVNTCLVTTSEQIEAPWVDRWLTGWGCCLHALNCSFISQHFLLFIHFNFIVQIRLIGIVWIVWCRTAFWSGSANHRNLGSNYTILADSKGFRQERFTQSICSIKGAHIFQKM